MTTRGGKRGKGPGLRIPGGSELPRAPAAGEGLRRRRRPQPESPKSQARKACHTLESCCRPRRGRRDAPVRRRTVPREGPAGQAHGSVLHATGSIERNVSRI